MTSVTVAVTEAPPAPELEVVGVEAARHAAAPTLIFTLRARVPEGREVYTVALSTQIHFEPARRRYDDETKALLVDLFGTPDRWGVTTMSFVWQRVDVLIPSFTGETTFELPVPGSYDLEVAATKFIYSLADGEVPLAFHFTGSVLYPDGAGRLQFAPVPWSATASYRMPVAEWRRMIDAHYSNSGWIRLHADTLRRLAERKTDRGLPSFDAVVEELLEP